MYEANCARCHGANGEGGIGPVAQRPGQAVRPPQRATTSDNVLTVGGRYVCGNPNSLMPVWSDRATRRAAQLHPDRRPDRVHPRARTPRPTRSATRSSHEPKHRPDHRRGPDVQGLGRPELQAGTRRDAVPGLLVDAFATPSGSRRRRPGPRRRPRSTPNAPVVDAHRPSGIAVHDRPTLDARRPDTPFVDRRSTTRTPASRTTSRSRTRPARSSSRATIVHRASRRSDYQVPALAAGDLPVRCAPSTRT